MNYSDVRTSLRHAQINSMLAEFEEVSPPAGSPGDSVTGDAESEIYLIYVRRTISIKEPGNVMQVQINNVHSLCTRDEILRMCPIVDQLTTLAPAIYQRNSGTGEYESLYDLVPSLASSKIIYVSMDDIEVYRKTLSGTM